MLLQEISEKYLTDKRCSNFIRNGLNITGHCYAPLYEKYLSSYRDKEATLLEIGVQGGDSLLMWAEYLKKANIWGIDDCSSLDEPVRTEFDDPRIHFAKGSQDDPIFLEQLAKKAGPFDVIIDDGSHLSHHNIFSFTFLRKYVKNGGFYIIEDLHCSDYPSYTPIGESTKTYLNNLNNQSVAVDIYDKICFIKCY